MNNELQIIKFDSKNHLEDYMNSEELIIRFQLEQLISSDNLEKESWFHYGYCQCCKKNSRFILDWKYSYPKHVNFRERLVCERCELNNRQRFTFSYMRNVLGAIPHGKKVYLYEQVTNLYHQAKQQFTTCEVIGSEYLGFDKKSGEVFDEIRHEDAMNLSFQNETFDLIVSNDVYEHVPNIELSFKEASRTLKKDGVLLFTVPFHHFKDESRRRCEIIDGNLIHYMDEEYHGNPIAEEKGSLVFYNYGWDIVDKCRENGFSECNVIMYYGYFYGYIGTHFMFLAKK